MSQVAPSPRAFLALVVSLLLALALLGTLATPVRAAGISVETTADELTADEVCSLREAIISANLNTAVGGCEAGEAATVDVINVPAGTYTLALTGPEPTGLDATVGDLDLVGSVSIAGAGASTTTVDANEIDRVFQVWGGAGIVSTAVSMSGLTITGGDQQGGGISIDLSGQLTGTSIVVTGNDVGSLVGGGIYVNPTSTLDLIASVVSDNQAGVGGGIYADSFFSGADVDLTTTTVSGNSAGLGGGIRVGGLATLSLDRSTVSGNSATGDGGGIHSAGDVSLVNSTISGNTAGGEGGGIDMSNDIVVHFSTITANTAAGTGAGINLTGDAELFASIVADNTGGDCFEDDGSFNSLGSNIDSDGTCELDQTTDQASTDPALGSLASNGGPTQTHALTADSPAIDAATDVTPACVATDQRGVVRPVDGDEDGTAACDIGAYEFVPPVEEPPALPEASINDVSVTEGNSGTVDAVFTVTLSAASSGTVTMAYATANGTATTPADYQAAAGTVTFTPGDTSETITVKVVGDTLDEPNETFFVNLTAPVGATLADAQGTGTILDDDGAPAQPAASINDVSVTEGNSGTVDAVFTVTLSAASSGTVTMAYATANGTATAPADYLAAAGTVTFTPGDVSETITVKVVGDTLDEPNETFFVNLTAPVGATLADAQGKGTILDNDPAQQVLADTNAAPARSPAAWIGFAMAVLLLTGVAFSAVRLTRRGRVGNLR